MGGSNSPVLGESKGKNTPKSLHNIPECSNNIDLLTFQTSSQDTMTSQPHKLIPKNKITFGNVGDVSHMVMRHGKGGRNSDFFKGFAPPSFSPSILSPSPGVPSSPPLPTSVSPSFRENIRQWNEAGDELTTSIPKLRERDDVLKVEVPSSSLGQELQVPSDSILEGDASLPKKMKMKDKGTRKGKRKGKRNNGLGSLEAQGDSMEFVGQGAEDIEEDSLPHSLPPSLPGVSTPPSPVGLNVVKGELKGKKGKGRKAASNSGNTTFNTEILGTSQTSFPTTTTSSTMGTDLSKYIERVINVAKLQILGANETVNITYPSGLPILRLRGGASDGSESAKPYTSSPAFTNGSNQSGGRGGRVSSSSPSASLSTQQAAASASSNSTGFLRPMERMKSPAASSNGNVNRNRTGLVAVKIGINARFTSSSINNYTAATVSTSANSAVRIKRPSSSLSFREVTATSNSNPSSTGNLNSRLYKHYYEESSTAPPLYISTSKANPQATSVGRSSRPATASGSSSTSFQSSSNQSSLTTPVNCMPTVTQMHPIAVFQQQMPSTTCSFETPPVVTRENSGPVDVKYGNGYGSSTSTSTLSSYGGGGNSSTVKSNINRLSTSRNSASPFSFGADVYMSGNIKLGSSAAGILAASSATTLYGLPVSVKDFEIPLEGNFRTTLGDATINNQSQKQAQLQQQQQTVTLHSYAEKLDLSGKEFTSCPLIIQHVYLTYLDLHHNFIRSIDSIVASGGGKNLVVLDLYGNHLTSLLPNFDDQQSNGGGGLEEMPHLRTLLLGRNALTSLRGIQALPRLDTLDLHSNSLKSLDLSLLSSLVCLRVLNVSDNALEIIPSMQGMSNLVDLNLSRNRISKFCQNSGMTKVTRLNLLQNNFGSSLNGDWERGVEGLWTLQALQDLQIDAPSIVADTLISSSSSNTQATTYKATLITNLPSLKLLNSRRVLPETKRSAFAMARRIESKKREIERREVYEGEKERYVRDIGEAWELAAHTSSSYIGENNLGGGIDQGRTAYVELEGSTLRLFGTSGLPALQRPDSHNSTSISLEFCELEVFLPYTLVVGNFFGRLVELDLGRVNLHSLYQVVPLQNLHNLKTLLIHNSNPILSFGKMFREFTIALLPVVEKLCGEEVGIVERRRAAQKYQSFKILLSRSDPTHQIASKPAIKLHTKQIYQSSEATDRYKISKEVENLIDDSIRTHAKRVKIHAMFEEICCSAEKMFLSQS